MKKLLIIISSILLLSCAARAIANSDYLWTNINAFDGAIKVNADWNVYSNEKAYRGIEMLSKTVGAYAELTFEGSAIRWYGSRGRARGQARVYLNGDVVAELDLFSPEVSNRVLLLQQDNLEEGVHTLRIEVTGKSNHGTLLPFVSIDSLAYIPTTSVMRSEIEHFYAAVLEQKEVKPESALLKKNLEEALICFEDLSTANQQELYAKLKEETDRIIALTHTGNITYSLQGSADWPPNVQQRIIHAMDTAVALYNEVGDFNIHLTVIYDPGVPTAQANYNGTIWFGGMIGTRVALHEISHTLGIGTYHRWGDLAVDGKWTGKEGKKLLQELDGPNAVLYADTMHFWPYGLNYDSEASELNYIRHIKMVRALQRDMGL